MAVAQEILAAQDRLNAAVAAVSAKVDALIAASVSPVDTAAVVEKITASAVALEAVVAK